MDHWTSLELKLTSCKDLKAFNFFQKLSAYAVVSIVTINEQPKKKQQPQQQQRLQRQKTGIEQRGKNPEWNQVFQFDLQLLPTEETDNLFLKFDLRTDGLVHRTIGEVRVPLKDLIDEFRGVVRFLTYQVRDGDGKPNGVLNFSYKLKGKIETSVKSSSSSPEITHCSSEKVFYPKVELDDDQSRRRDVIRYPSLDDDDAYKNIVSPPVFQWQTPVTTAGSYYMQVPSQGLVHTRYFDPYSTSSTMEQQQPSGTYWHRVESNFLR